MEKKLDNVESLLLETISFFEPMTKEMIILDFDNNKQDCLESFTIKDLEQSLELLIKQKLVKKIKHSNGDIYYQRILPKKPWWKRLL